MATGLKPPLIKSFTVFQVYAASHLHFLLERSVVHPGCLNQLPGSPGLRIVGSPSFPS